MSQGYGDPNNPATAERTNTMTSTTSLINTLTNSNTSTEAPVKPSGLQVKTGLKGGVVRIPRGGGNNHNQTVVR